MEFNTFDTYQAEIAVPEQPDPQGRGPHQPPRPGPVRTPARRGHPHRPLTAPTLSSDEHRHGAGEQSGAGADN